MHETHTGLARVCSHGIACSVERAGKTTSATLRPISIAGGPEVRDGIPRSGKRFRWLVRSRPTQAVRQGPAVSHAVRGEHYAVRTLRLFTVPVARTFLPTKRLPGPS